MSYLYGESPLCFLYGVSSFLEEDDSHRNQDGNQKSVDSAQLASELNQFRSNQNSASSKCGWWNNLVAQLIGRPASDKKHEINRMKKISFRQLAIAQSLYCSISSTPAQINTQAARHWVTAISPDGWHVAVMQSRSVLILFNSLQQNYRNNTRRKQRFRFSFPAAAESNSQPCCSRQVHWSNSGIYLAALNLDGSIHVMRLPSDSNNWITSVCADEYRLQEEKGSVVTMTVLERESDAILLLLAMSSGTIISVVLQASSSSKTVSILNSLNKSGKVEVEAALWIHSRSSFAMVYSHESDYHHMALSPLNHRHFNLELVSVNMDESDNDVHLSSEEERYRTTISLVRSSDAMEFATAALEINELLAYPICSMQLSTDGRLLQLLHGDGRRASVIEILNDEFKVVIDSLDVASRTGDLVDDKPSAIRSSVFFDANLCVYLRDDGRMLLLNFSCNSHKGWEALPVVVDAAPPVLGLCCGISNYGVRRDTSDKGSELSSAVVIRVIDPFTYQLFMMQLLPPLQAIERKVLEGKVSEAMQFAASAGVDEDEVKKLQWQLCLSQTDREERHTGIGKINILLTKPAAILDSISNRSLIFKLSAAAHFTSENLEELQAVLEVAVQSTDHLSHAAERIVDDTAPTASHADMIDSFENEMNSSTAAILRCRRFLLMKIRKLRLLRYISDSFQLAGSENNIASNENVCAQEKFSLTGDGDYSDSYFDLLDSELRVAVEDCAEKVLNHHTDESCQRNDAKHVHDGSWSILELLNAMVESGIVIDAEGNSDAADALWNVTVEEIACFCAQQGILHVAVVLLPLIITRRTIDTIDPSEVLHQQMLLIMKVIDYAPPYTPSHHFESAFRYLVDADYLMETSLAQLFTPDVSDHLQSSCNFCDLCPDDLWIEVQEQHWEGFCDGNNLVLQHKSFRRKPPTSPLSVGQVIVWAVKKALAIESFGYSDSAGDLLRIALDTCNMIALPSFIADKDVVALAEELKLHLQHYTQLVYDDIISVEVNFFEWVLMPIHEKIVTAIKHCFESNYNEKSDEETPTDVRVTNVVKQYLEPKYADEERKLSTSHTMSKALLRFVVETSALEFCLQRNSDSTMQVIRSYRNAEKLELSTEEDHRDQRAEWDCVLSSAVIETVRRMDVVSLSPIEAVVTNSKANMSMSDRCIRSDYFLVLTVIGGCFRYDDVDSAIETMWKLIECTPAEPLDADVAPFKNVSSIFIDPQYASSVLDALQDALSAAEVIKPYLAVPPLSALLPRHSAATSALCFRQSSFREDTLLLQFNFKKHLLEGCGFLLANMSDILRFYVMTETISTEFPCSASAESLSRRLSFQQILILRICYQGASTVTRSDKWVDRQLTWTKLTVDILEMCRLPYFQSIDDKQDIETLKEEIPLTLWAGILLLHTLVFFKGDELSNVVHYVFDSRTGSSGSSSDSMGQILADHFGITPEHVGSELLRSARETVNCISSAVAESEELQMAKSLLMLIPQEARDEAVHQELCVYQILEKVLEAQADVVPLQLRTLCPPAFVRELFRSYPGTYKQLILDDPYSTVAKDAIDDAVSTKQALLKSRPQPAHAFIDLLLSLHSCREQQNYDSLEIGPVIIEVETVLVFLRAAIATGNCGEEAYMHSVYLLRRERFHQIGDPLREEVVETIGLVMGLLSEAEWRDFHEVLRKDLLCMLLQVCEVERLQQIGLLWRKLELPSNDLFLPLTTNSSPPSSAHYMSDAISMIADLLSFFIPNESQSTEIMPIMQSMTAALAVQIIAQIRLAGPAHYEAAVLHLVAARNQAIDFMSQITSANADRDINENKTLQASVANVDFVDVLVKKGFSRNGAIRSVLETRNESVDAALMWAVQHSLDDDFEHPYVSPAHDALLAPSSEALLHRLGSNSLPQAFAKCSEVVYWLEWIAETVPCKLPAAEIPQLCLRNVEEITSGRKADEKVEKSDEVEYSSGPINTAREELTPAEISPQYARRGVKKKLLGAQKLVIDPEDFDDSRAEQHHQNTSSQMCGETSPLLVLPEGEVNAISNSPLFRAQDKLDGKIFDSDAQWMEGSRNSEEQSFVHSNGTDAQIDSLYERGNYEVNLPQVNEQSEEVQQSIDGCVEQLRKSNDYDEEGNCDLNDESPYKDESLNAIVKTEEMVDDSIAIVSAALETAVHVMEQLNCTELVPEAFDFVGVVKSIFHESCSGSDEHDYSFHYLLNVCSTLAVHPSAYAYDCMMQLVIAIKAASLQNNNFNFCDWMAVRLMQQLGVEDLACIDITAAPTVMPQRTVYPLSTHFLGWCLTAMRFTNSWQNINDSDEVEHERNRMSFEEMIALDPSLTLLLLSRMYRDVSDVPSIEKVKHMAMTVLGTGDWSSGYARIVYLMQYHSLMHSDSCRKSELMVEKQDLIAILNKQLQADVALLRRINRIITPPLYGCDLVQEVKAIIMSDSLFGSCSDAWGYSKEQIQSHRHRAVVALSDLINDIKVLPQWNRAVGRLLNLGPSELHLIYALQNLPAESNKLPLLDVICTKLKAEHMIVLILSLAGFGWICIQRVTGYICVCEIVESSLRLQVTVLESIELLEQMVRITIAHEESKAFAPIIELLHQLLKGIDCLLPHEQEELLNDCVGDQLHLISHYLPALIVRREFSPSAIISLLRCLLDTHFKLCAHFPKLSSVQSQAKLQMYGDGAEASEDLGFMRNTSIVLHNAVDAVLERIHGSECAGDEMKSELQEMILKVFYLCRNTIAVAEHSADQCKSYQSLHYFLERLMRVPGAFGTEICSTSPRLHHFEAGYIWLEELQRENGVLIDCTHQLRISTPAARRPSSCSSIIALAALNCLLQTVQQDPWLMKYGQIASHQLQLDVHLSHMASAGILPVVDAVELQATFTSTDKLQRDPAIITPEANNRIFSNLADIANTAMLVLKLCNAVSAYNSSCTDPEKEQLVVRSTEVVIHLLRRCCFSLLFSPTAEYVESDTVLLNAVLQRRFTQVSPPSQSAVRDMLTVVLECARNFAAAEQPVLLMNLLTIDVVILVEWCSDVNVRSHFLHDLQGFIDEREATMGFCSKALRHLYMEYTSPTAKLEEYEGELLDQFGHFGILELSDESQTQLLLILRLLNLRASRNCGSSVSTLLRTSNGHVAGAVLSLLSATAVGHVELRRRVDASELLKSSVTARGIVQLFTQLRPCVAVQSGLLTSILIGGKHNSSFSTIDQDRHHSGGKETCLIERSAATSYQQQCLWHHLHSSQLLSDDKKRKFQNNLPMVVQPVLLVAELILSGQTALAANWHWQMCRRPMTMYSHRSAVAALIRSMQCAAKGVRLSGALTDVDCDTETQRICEQAMLLLQS